ncbi:hypothetical protein AADR41_17855 [Streptomyces sp. CLV115]|uniref:hypothetical protein n=1 Tax=Streptomyces sp. CLV115 TaxID=3138502 RepID=UPI00313BD0B8
MLSNNDKSGRGDGQPLLDVAVAVSGAYDDVERVAHIHIGIPIAYRPAAQGLATSGPTSFMESTARRAAGSAPEEHAQPPKQPAERANVQ